MTHAPRGGSVGWHTMGALSVLSGMALVGCGGLTAPELEAQIVGSWTWIESTGGIAGVTRTPDSTGEMLALRFESNGVVQVFRNGQFERAVGYTTTPSRDDATLSVQYDEPLFGFDSQTVSLPDRDTLVLTDPCCDGFAYRFGRAP